MWSCESRSKSFYPNNFTCRHSSQRINHLCQGPWSLLYHRLLHPPPHWDSSRLLGATLCHRNPVALGPQNLPSPLPHHTNIHTDIQPYSSKDRRLGVCCVGQHITLVLDQVFAVLVSLTALPGLHHHGELSTIDWANLPLTVMSKG